MNQLENLWTDWSTEVHVCEWHFTPQNHNTPTPLNSVVCLHLRYFHFVSRKTGQIKKKVTTESIWEHGIRNNSKSSAHPLAGWLLCIKLQKHCPETNSIFPHSRNQSIAFPVPINHIDDCTHNYLISVAFVLFFYLFFRCFFQHPLYTHTIKSISFFTFSQIYLNSSLCSEHTNYI